MNSTSRGVIVIGSSADWVGCSEHSFIVHIDGRQTGRVRPGLTGEFTVDPGTHMVAVSMSWAQSRRVQVVVEPGSKTELVIRGRQPNMTWWKELMPFVVVALMSQAITGVVQALPALATANWLVRTGVAVAVGSVIIFVGLLLVTWLFVPDYLVRWTLERVGKTSPQPPVGGG